MNFKEARRKERLFYPTVLDLMSSVHHDSFLEPRRWRMLGKRVGRVSNKRAK